MHVRRLRRIFLLLTILILSSCVSRVSYRELAQEYYNLGNAFFELGDFERSFEYYTRALELDDTLPAAGYNLARLHGQRGQYKDALEVISDLIQLDPENGLYRETAAYFRYRLGNIDTARAEYRVLIDRYPSRTRLRYNLALLELELGQPARAKEVLVAAIDDVGDDPEYYWLTAEASYKSGAATEALGYLDRYRALVDDDDSLARLARRYAEWEFALAAMDVLDEISDTVARDPALTFLKGRLFMVYTADFEAGIELLESALEAGFDDLEQLQRLLDDVRESDREFVEEIYVEHEIALSGTPESQPEEEASSSGINE